MFTRLYNWFRKGKSGSSRSAKQVSRQGSSVHRTGTPKAVPGARTGQAAQNAASPARKKFVREDSGTHETLKILDDSIVEADQRDGFDPYNTGEFDRSKNWERSFRD